ncbi:hypothetical protein F4860DRAFT_484320 [Xylaria cubensis]|nr:hypothetical protein F4860DRAFT_484320 [Xylaria cubensis]
MAQHPHGYGQHFGHYAPPASFPMLPASSPAQPSYYYPQPQAAPPTLPANYATSQSAYSHNSTRIPGLGLGGGPMAPAPPFPPALAQQWPAQGQPQTNTYLQSHQQPPSSLPQKPSVSHQQPHNALEEGELSEGEFEDLYEPKAPTDPSQAPLHNKPHHTLISLDSRGGSVGDADGSSIYDPHDPQVTHDDSATQARSNTAPSAAQECPDDEWEPSYPDRERSGSYSPYLSPREVHRKHSIGKITSKTTDRVESSKSTQQTDIPLPKTSSAMAQPNETNFALGANNVGPTSASKHEPYANGLSPIRSPLEAKKKAQEAILGLWPLKVRYQDYIDEGVDTNVVKTLFKDLGLDVPNPKTVTVSTKTTNDVQSTPVRAVPPSNTSPKPQSPSTRKTQAPLPDVNQPNRKDDKSKSGGTKVAEKSAAEERKDKIARKLAAMAQKTTTAQPPGQGASASTPVSAPASAAADVAVSVPSPSPAPIPAPAPVETTPSTAGTKLDSATTQSAVTKTRAENNAILQQKLAALKKQQAQLAAEKARVISNESTTASSPAVEPTHVDTNRNGNSTPNNRPVASVQQNSNQQNELPGISKDEGIPGLSFPSLSLPQSAQGSSRSLKRPVASDFDNFTPRFEPLKRTRTDERLVIDVSDDEDVEMDIGSPTEELQPSADSNGAPPRPALGTFPPLSDGLNRRQQDSPASSSAPTPPVHGARIDLLQKRIEEAKRLIAEAEAKKAAKKATTQSSPKLSSQSTLPPVNLPKVDESNLEAKRIVDSRRDRIASYELPRVNAALKEKQDKLKLLVAEAARLELEVQASLDEQRKLETEMDCLVEPSTIISPKPIEQPKTRDGKYPGLGTQLPVQAPNTFTGSPQSEQITASKNHQSLLEKQSGDAEPSRNRESPSANMNGGMDPELNNDEVLQAAILSDNTHAMDTQMTDADGPSLGTDNAPVINETIAADISPSSLDTSGPAETSMAELEQDMEQPAEEFSTDADVEVGSIAKSDTSPSEPDVESSESDVSMQQSIAELSQSDDESYEPKPAEISDSHGVRKDEQNNTEVIEHSPFLGDYPLTKLQVIDDILEEPSPTHTSTDRNRQEPENTSKEVKYRSCKEPLLLTNSQDALRNTPPLELLSYKSPLSYFRAYRFHPKYFEEVPGGLKSMTFSARIDPMREVCPHALAGETCPKGPGCEYQHFDSMTLQDAEIITQLGSADMFVGEARTKFIEGLKRLLNELKANRVKDFDRITQAIVKHRQDFLGDKTKVLALDSGAT